MSKWKRVEAPKPWAPTHVGEELIGYYRGERTIDGRYGPYRIFLIATADGSLLYVSGTVVSSLFSGLLLSATDRVKVVYRGIVAFGNDDRFYKDYYVFVENK